ncbi:hypothetical protein [Couchioplanes azureus]|nr:hypothetical protein [Couchioplanes caeruleus]
MALRLQNPGEECIDVGVGLSTPVRGLFGGQGVYLLSTEHESVCRLG